MTATMAVPPEVAAYLARVRSALRDLPESEREDLLSEVEGSLAESTDDVQGSIASRLGPPEDFAAELRAAAGLHPAPAQATGSPAERSQWESVRESLRQIAGPARRVGHELAPAWWFVRGYVLVAIAAYLPVVGLGWSYARPYLPVVGMRGLAVLALFCSIVLSVAVGLWTRNRRPNALLAVVNVILAIASIPVLVHFAHGQMGPVFYDQAAQSEPAPFPMGLTVDGAPVNNLYVYGKSGHLLHDVLIFDENGNPLTVADQVTDPQRRLLYTRGGKPIYNSFPIRYFEPGTNRVAKPDARPAIKVPVLRKPAPLKPPRR